MLMTMAEPTFLLAGLDPRCVPTDLDSGLAVVEFAPGVTLLESVFGVT